MAKGFTPAPESPQRQAQPKERKLAVNAEQVQEQWLSHFQTLVDPRGKQGQEHAILTHRGYCHLGSGGWSHGMGRH